MNTLWHQVRYALPLWLVGLLTNWWPDNRVSLRVRGWLATPFIRKCGKGLWLGAYVSLLNSDKLDIGDHCYIARGTWLNCLGGLTLEDEVVIAPYVVISTLQHVFKDRSVRFGGSIARPVRVGKGTWIAAHASVKCGVTIGCGSIIAANACVVRDVPDYVIAGGVPAKVVGENRDGEAEFMDRAEMLERSREGAGT